MAEVAVTAKPKLDARKLRADFPIFEQVLQGSQKLAAEEDPNETS